MCSLSRDAPRGAQEKFALKVVDRSKANRHKKLDEVVVEKWVLANLSHPSIIRIYQTFQDRAAMYLVLEHVPGGELWAVSHGRGIRPSLASFYVAQVCPPHARTRDESLYRARAPIPMVRAPWLYTWRTDGGGVTAHARVP